MPYTTESPSNQKIIVLKNNKADKLKIKIRDVIIKSQRIRPKNLFRVVLWMAKKTINYSLKVAQNAKRVSKQLKKKLRKQKKKKVRDQKWKAPEFRVKKPKYSAKKQKK